LTEAYRDLFPAKSIPFGLFNRYNKIPHAFSAVVAISGLGILSDAIVCRAKWNDFGILYERDIMLGEN